ncbi:HPr family phosphocarrier protein [Pseudonocardia sp. ICBG1293]|uniref:HPr family phosphocarrier protein n=1 Tax=Pseudonocardia sp. ICBG1293 TaxID=2844382 RepID=UPI001CCD4290|nr:HPr family phosphocarrier protein [Pseudonocardia sp. ICBG1293]
MHTRTAVVASRVGLHARPAALFARAAGATGLPVTVATAEKGPVDARSVLALMTLGVVFGDEVVLRAGGDDAPAALDGLVALLETDHDA